MPPVPTFPSFQTPPDLVDYLFAALDHSVSKMARILSELALDPFTSRCIDFYAMASLGCCHLRELATLLGAPTPSVEVIDLT